MILTKQEVMDRLQHSLCKVVFTKKGTEEERTLTCTLLPGFLPESKPSEKVRAEPSTDAIRVFEVELQAWRSFNLSNLVSIDIIVPHRLDI